MNNAKDDARRGAIDQLCAEGASREFVTEMVNGDIKVASSLFSARAKSYAENNRTEWHEKVRDQARGLRGTLTRMQRDRPNTLSELVNDADLRHLLTTSQAKPRELLPLVEMLETLESAAHGEAMRQRNKRSSSHDRTVAYQCLHTFQRFLGGDGTKVRRTEFSRYVEQIYVAAGNPPELTMTGKSQNGKSIENRTAIESAIKLWHQKRAEN